MCHQDVPPRGLPFFVFLFSLVFGPVAAFPQSLAEDKRAQCLSPFVVVSAFQKGVSAKDAVPIEGFQVRVSDEIVPITRIEPNQNPKRVAVLLDTSGSMFETADKWKIAQLVVSDFLGLIPDHTALGLATFDDKLKTVVKLDDDRLALKKALDNLSFEALRTRKGVHRTSLTDSLMEAADSFGLSSGDVIYVVTDGFDNSSKNKLKLLKTKLITYGIRLFVVLLRNPAEERLLMMNADPVDFENFAIETGGFTLNVFTQSFGSPAISDLGNFRYVINNDSRIVVALVSNYVVQSTFGFYKLQIKLPQALSESRKLTIELVNSKRVEASKLPTLNYPRHLFPCELLASR